jgi:hypothetical protein
MKAEWIAASVTVSATHESEFEATCEEAIDPCDAMVMPYRFLHVRFRDPADEPLLMLAVNGCGQHYRVSAANYEFPTEWEAEVRELVSFHRVQASIVPAARYHLELRYPDLLGALRAALLRKAPTFGATYPRVVIA